MAQYPSAIKSFTTRNAGDVIQPSHINDLQDEVNAIETGLLTSMTHPIVLTSGQIAFPATQAPSAGANTLDDYEEGTWTPGISFGSAAVGITYSIQTGQYTKIGNVVHISAHLGTTSKGSSTGAARITGLPFAAGAAGPSLSFGLFGGFAVSFVSLYGLLTGGTTVDFNGLTAAAANTTPLTDTSFNNAVDLYFSGTYFSS